MSLAENGMSYKDYQWSRAWELFKENLRSANQVFYTLFAIEGVLLWHVEAAHENETKTRCA